MTARGGPEESSSTSRTRPEATASARVGTRSDLYDVLVDGTDPDLVFFELDLYWIVTAGRDPLDY